MQLGIGDTQIVFLFAGKLESKKDPLLLIKAFQARDNPRSNLLIVGSGPLEQQLRSLIVDDERIIFLPFQNQHQMPIVYRLGDVYVLPSKGPGEAWGLAVNEAMASGKAVIVSNKCGCANDLFPNQLSRCFFPAGDVKALTNRMEMMLENNAFIEIGRKN